MAKKLLGALFLFGLWVSVLSFKEVSAQQSCSITVLAQGVPGARSGIEGYPNAFTISGLRGGITYTIRFPREGLDALLGPKDLGTFQADQNGHINFIGVPGEQESSSGTHRLRIYEGNVLVCEKEYIISDPIKACTPPSIQPEKPGANSPLTLTFTNLPQNIFAPRAIGSLPSIKAKMTQWVGDAKPNILPRETRARANVTLNISPSRAVGQHSVLLEICRSNLSIPKLDSRCKPACMATYNIGRQEGEENSGIASPAETREPRIDASKPERCGNQNQGIDTAIGCIPVLDTNAFVGWFLRWAVGLGGGIAFLMIVFSAFQIMTAGNNPQQLQGGRELLTAAISGLILIIFSVFLLRLIGVQILGIPGLGG